MVEIAQEKSMARLAEILESEGVVVVQYFEVGELEHGSAVGRITFRGDDNEGFRVLSICKEYGFTEGWLDRHWEIRDGGAATALSDMASGISERLNVCRLLCDIYGL